MGFNEIVPSENFLGWIMFTMGCLRIIGLVINGARKNVTPQIRQISAAAGCLVWSGIAYAFASSGVISTWIAIYPLFAIGELINIHRAAHDQGGKHEMEKLAELPPLAMVVFGATLAVIFAVRYFGLSAGANARPEKSPAGAQVAAVIVDPTALNNAAEAMRAHTAETINMRKSFERGTDKICDAVDRLSDQIDDLQKEMIRRGG
ncbi:hypothetical protein [Agrobacterium pusense]|uniref:hypothetical protein n=1 Tax=Agrobacterium pusense TaxID=648995 RepID=UPI002F422612